MGVDDELDLFLDVEGTVFGGRCFSGMPATSSDLTGTKTLLLVLITALLPLLLG